MRCRSHICLVHDVSIDAALPALDPLLRPSDIYLLASPEREAQARWLESILLPEGITVHLKLLRDPWSVSAVRDQVLSVLMGRGPNDVALNLSGAFGPMGIGAYEAFRGAGRPVFYVHPERNCLVWVHPEEGLRSPLAGRMTLVDFLRAHGAAVNENPVDLAMPRGLRALTRELVSGVERLAKPMASLNWFAYHVDDDRCTLPLDSGYQKWGELQTLIDRFAEFSLIERRGERLRFPDEGARRYVNGGWLEDHVTTYLEQIRAESTTIQDMARGLEYVRLNDASAIKNELDVAFLAGNRLHIIECKTKRFQCTLNPDAPGADALYKLDGVRQQLGGRQARVLLVSYQPLQDSHRQRAADMGIRICVGREIHYIAELLREWAGTDEEGGSYETIGAETGRAVHLR
jgi:hypothetical protein